MGLQRYPKLTGGLIAASLVMQLQPLQAFADTPSVPEGEYAHEQQDSVRALQARLSRTGNTTSLYTNVDDGRQKVIVWAAGITEPPRMGEDSNFVRETYSAGGRDYVTYYTPYAQGNGWYDINKSPGREFDQNLCFAAAAANSLHWWLDRNASYIDTYLAAHPDDVHATDIARLRTSFNNQHDSSIFTIFLQQFGGRQEGFWPDGLQNQFINGYYPKANGGTNDSPLDREKLATLGPDKHGGFFASVFGEELLTKRHYYAFGYEPISRDIVTYMTQGDLLTLTYSMGGRVSHVVTLWGAEFDQDGSLCAVYFTDSDDEDTYGMQRYKLVNRGGRAYLTTTTDNQGGSLVESLGVLSTGKATWEKVLGIQNTSEAKLPDTTETIPPAKPSDPSSGITGDGSDTGAPQTEPGTIPDPGEGSSGSTPSKPHVPSDGQGSGTGSAGTDGSSSSTGSDHSGVLPGGSVEPSLPGDAGAGASTADTTTPPSPGSVDPHVPEHPGTSSGATTPTDVSGTTGTEATPGTSTPSTSGGGDALPSAGSSSAPSTSIVGIPGAVVPTHSGLDVVTPVVPAAGGRFVATPGSDASGLGTTQATRTDTQRARNTERRGSQSGQSARQTPRATPQASASGSGQEMSQAPSASKTTQKQEEKQPATKVTPGDQNLKPASPTEAHEDMSLASRLGIAALGILMMGLGLVVFAKKRRKQD